MININLNQLNELEQSIHSKLSKMIENNDNPKIIDAAQYCGVSPSKISKLARKLGFENFKQYKQYLSGKPVITKNKKISNELERLKNFLEHFDPDLVDKFITIFNKYNRIVLFGLGPSFICVEYFAYKLALVSDKSIVTTHSEDYAQHLVDEETLFIVFSVTGRFISYETLFNHIKARGSEILLILEEYNPLDLEIDHIFHLTTSNQDENLLAFEKTRTVFFIFIEEIIAKLMAEKNNKN